MAVTSAFSAELIAISSLFTYDIYHAYVNPKASGKRLVTVSHMSCVVFSLAMAGFAVGLYYGGISMGYLYVMMGVIISSAVVPICFSLLWKDQNAVAAAASPVLGLICALTAWLVTAKKEYGELTVDSTNANNPMLAGNVTALLSPLVFSPVLTLVFGRQKYDWKSMMDVRRVDDSDVVAEADVDVEQVPGQNEAKADDWEEEQRMLKKTSRIARILTVAVALCFIILWPMPMYGSSYVFSKPFFRGWIIVGIIWLFGTAFGVVIFPLWEGRHTIALTFRSMWMDVTGRRGKALSGQRAEANTSDDDYETMGTKTPDVNKADA
ncbi:hypothetical protein KEM55_002397 [Ascosphaera atra]|nr:hypothetical protein KEM55_002397 [Ascosphaera atra]